MFTSEGGEVINIDHCLFAFTLGLGFLLSFFLMFTNWLLSKTKSLQIFIKSNFSWREFNQSLSISLTVFLVFLWFKNSQLLLFDPFSIDVNLFGYFLLIDVAQFNSLVFVILFESESFGFFRLGFSSRLFSFYNWSFILMFFSIFLDVFVLVEIILNISNVSSTSSFFSGSVSRIRSNILSASAASSVKIMSLS